MRVDASMSLSFDLAKNAGELMKKLMIAITIQSMLLLLCSCNALQTGGTPTTLPTTSFIEITTTGTTAGTTTETTPEIMTYEERLRL
jgi:hypothetical protein